MMNAVELVQGLRNTIEAELDALERAIQYRNHSISGSCFIGDKNGTFDVSDMRRAVNADLINYCRTSLGFSVIDHFSYRVGHHYEGTSLHEKAQILTARYNTSNLTALEYLDTCVEVLQIDEYYFEKLLAYFFVADKNALSDPATYADQIRYNGFSFDFFSSSINRHFHVNAEKLVSFLMVLSHVLDKEVDPYSIRANIAKFSRLEAFLSTTELLYNDIKVTALKNGKIKFNLDNDLTQKLRSKVEPHITSVKVNFVG